MATILLLHENDDLGRRLRADLAKAGHRVVVAETGDRGSSRCSRGDIDVAVVGQLKDTSGIGFIAQLRHDTVNVPVVFLAALYQESGTILREIMASLDVSRVLFGEIEPSRLTTAVGQLAAANS